MSTPQRKFWQRVAVKRMAPAPERRTHIALADLLRAAALPGWWFSHIPSGEYRTEATGALLKRMGLRPGMADLMLLGHGGVYFLEIKRRPNGLTYDQQIFRDAVLAAGAHFEVAWSYDEAVAILIRWGCLSRRVVDAI